MAGGVRRCSVSVGLKNGRVGTALFSVRSEPDLCAGVRRSWIATGSGQEHNYSGIELISMQFTTFCYDWQDCDRIGG